MGVGWITQIWNGSDRGDVAIQSVDHMNNGRIWFPNTNKDHGQDLQDGGWHNLNPNSHYFSEFCGVPWLSGPPHEHFKSLGNLRSPNDSMNIRMYQAFVEPYNTIQWQSDVTGEIFLRQQVPADGDYACQLRFARDAGITVIPYIDILANGGVRHDFLYWRNEIEGWIGFGTGIVGPPSGKSLMTSPTCSSGLADMAQALDRPRVRLRYPNPTDFGAHARQ